MSKLIVCTGSLMAGGAERVLSILSKTFADNFDEVEYVLWLDSRYPNVFYKIDPRVKITKISKETNSTNTFKHCLWFRKHLLKSRDSVVLSFMVMINLSVMISLFGTKIPLILAERNDPRHFHHGKILRFIINNLYKLPNVKSIVMQTKTNKEYFSNSLQRKIKVIYNPISIDKINIGCSLGSEKQNKIVNVARLEKQKSHKVLIKAFQKFLINHPDYILSIYGEGSLKEDLEDMIINNGLANKVILHGLSSNIIHEISSAKMFVLTSQFEGMSNSLIEAMCIGLPCISTRVSGATDLIKHGENGYLVDVNNVDAVAFYMGEIASDAKNATNIGRKATDIYDILCSDSIFPQWISCLSKYVNK